MQAIPATVSKSPEFTLRIHFKYRKLISNLEWTALDMTATMINEEYRKVGIYKINVEVSRVAWSIKIDIFGDSVNVQIGYATTNLG